MCVHVFQTEAFPSFTSAHFQSHAVSPCSCQVPSEPPSTYKKLLTHTQTQSMGLYARCINTKGDRKAIDCRNCQNTSHTFELACANFAFCTKLISDRQKISIDSLYRHIQHIKQQQLHESKRICNVINQSVVVAAAASAVISILKIATQSGNYKI